MDPFNRYLQKPLYTDLTSFTKLFAFLLLDWQAKRFLQPELTGQCIVST